MKRPASSTKIGILDFVAASWALVSAISWISSACISLAFVLSMAVEMPNSLRTLRASWNLCTLPVAKNAILPFFNVASPALDFSDLLQHFDGGFFTDGFSVSCCDGFEAFFGDFVVRAL